MTRPDPENAVFVDFETEVSVDYNLHGMSARAYIQDDRFNVLTVALAEGAGPIRFFHKLAAPGATVIDAVAVIRRALERGKWLVCHNTGFDGLILALRFGIEAEHVFDTMGYAAYLGIGDSLANAARHIGLQKAEHPPFDETSLRDPQVLRRLARYNAMDMMITRRLFQAAIADPSFPDSEFSALDITLRNNLKGLRLDVANVDRVAASLVEARDRLLEDIAKKWTIDTSMLRSKKAMPAFLETTFGYRPRNLRKNDPELLAVAADNPRLAEFLAKRNTVGSLTKNASQLSRYATLGGRIYSPLRYCGSHTGRFSGSGKDCDRVNIHSLPKAEKAPHPAIAGIRTLIIPEPGRNFVAGDLSTIEPRVIAALAGEEAMMDIFRRGEDIYIWFGGYVFPGVRIVKNGENNHLRKILKEAVLGLGFGMGAATFKQRVRAVAPDAAEEDIRRVFMTYQDTFPGIRELRQAYWRAFRRAADYGESTVVGRCIFQRSGVHEAGPTVEVRLPTGRSIYYRAIQVTDAMAPWGPTKDYSYASDFEYVARPKRTGKKEGTVVKSSDGRLREFIRAHGVVENIVQAVARDIMVHQMLAIAAKGNLRPVFHVHDELVCECSACVCPEAAAGEHRHDCPWRAACAELLATMSRMPATLPELMDIPLEAEINEKVRETYAG